VDFIEDPLIRRVLGERYIIERFVGGGASGRVYSARHVRLGRQYAIKVLYGELSADPLTRARFEREADAAAQLDHPHLVPVLDAQLGEGELAYMVMDFMEGPDLESKLQREGPWPEERVREVLRQLASGLEYAHARGLVHRDLKPENILFVSDDRDRVRIADFGVAWVSEPEPKPGLTKPGDLIGTPGYMAPEQLMGRPVDARTDLYALGMVGYRMLLGSHPYGNTEVELMNATLEGEGPELLRHGVDAPSLEPLLRALCRREPAERPNSAAEVLAELDAPRVPTIAQDGSRTRWRREWLGLAALVMVGIALGIWGASGRSPTRPDDVGATAKPSDSLAAPALVGLGAGTATSTDRGPGPVEVKDGARISAEQDGSRPPSSRAPQRAPPSSTAKSLRPSRPPPQRPTPPPASVEELQSLYEDVGRRIDALDRAGHPRAEDLKIRYFAVPLVAALTRPELRAGVREQLRRLNRQARALKADRNGLDPTE